MMDVAQNSVRAEATLVEILVEESDKNDSLSIWDAERRRVRVTSKVMWT